MDLLGQENQKKEKSKGQKIVLTSLVICVALLIISIVLIYVLKEGISKTFSLNVNGKEIQISENLLIHKTTENNENITYISIERLSELVGYDYIKGGYLEYDENQDKSYIETDSQVIEYEKNSNVIYKIIPNANIDNEKYELSNKIIKENDMLYISLTDLNIGCNVVYIFNQEYNKMTIMKPEILLNNYAELLKTKELNADDDYNNQRAMSYNLLVATNKEGKTGVLELNENLNSIIGYKYNSMNFDEFSQNFIVSNEKNNYGVISKSGKTIIELRYEQIKIINHSPLLYSVKLNGKYGVLDENGRVVLNIEYDEIGFNTRTNREEPVLIIKNVNNNKDGIVVCKDKKYGILDLKTGEIILDFQTDKIYTKLSNSDKKQYFVEFNKKEVELKTFIEYVNTTTVITN